MSDFFSEGDSDSDWEDSPNRSSNHVNKLSTSASKKRKSAATARSKKGVKSTNQWGLEISEATASQVKGFKAKVQTTLTNFVSKPGASEAPSAPSETVKLRNREMSTKKPVRSEEEQFQVWQQNQSSHMCIPFLDEKIFYFPRT